MAKILIAARQKVVREHLQTVLGRKGHTVCEIHGSYEMSRTVFLKKPELILLDVDIHGADGFKVVRWLRNFPLGTDIPVVMLYVPKARLLEARHEGADVALPTDAMDVPNILLTVSRLLASPIRPGVNFGTNAK